MAVLRVRSEGLWLSSNTAESAVLALVLLVVCRLRFLWLRGVERPVVLLLLLLLLERANGLMMICAPMARGSKEEASDDSDEWTVTEPEDEDATRLATRST